MSEVRICKCDICGEVFHVDDNRHEKMLIFHDDFREDSGTRKSYNDICPRCCNSISELLKDPEIITKESSCRFALEQGLNKIYGKLNFFGFTPISYDTYDKSEYDHAIKYITDKIDSESEERQKTHKYINELRYKAELRAKIFMGISIGLAACAVLNIILSFII